MAARPAPSVVVPEFTVRPGYGLAYSGPAGRPRTHEEFDGMTSGPMEGVRVLDLSIALTGPYAAALFADQGAEVVKVERPGIGDIARWVGVAVNGMSSLYLVCNRGKRSIAVDIQQPEGAEIVRQLADRADVVIQNFRPGVLDRLGLGYDDVAARQPRRGLRVALGLRPRGPLPRPQRLRHGDPGLRRLRREPGRPRRRRARSSSTRRRPTR